tara:strand:+ start:234 stop:644 length:411 start_codon:yes stop_codon:yes gene_type:complete
MLLEVMLGCVLNLPPTTETINQYINCRDRQEIIELMSDYHQVVLDNFKIDDFEKAIRIIYCESTGRQYAVNNNKNGTQDKGIWQFNDKTWAWLSEKLKIQRDRFDIVISTKVASWLAYNDGWHHWNASKKCWKVNK